MRFRLAVNVRFGLVVLMCFSPARLRWARGELYFFDFCGSNSCHAFSSIQVLELAGNACRDNNKTRIIPRHIQLAIRNDEELGKLLASVTIAHGGVLPNIHALLLPKKTTAKLEKEAAKKAEKTPTKSDKSSSAEK